MVPGGSVAESWVRQKWRKWRNFVRMEKFPVGMEKIVVFGAATSRQYLVAFRQDTSNVHNVACSAPKCDFGAKRTPE